MLNNMDIKMVMFFAVVASIEINILWLDQLLDVLGVGVIGALEERSGQLNVGFFGGVVGIPEKVVVSVEAEGHVG